jgi:thiamine-phosphate pyrophosphorylase
MRLPPAPFLYPVVDAEFLAGRPVGPLIAGLLRGGARLVQLRVKGGPDGRFLSLAFEAVAAAKEGRGLLIVNDRPDIARMVGAQGVHLGQEDLDPVDARAFLGHDALVGLSTHSYAQVEAGLASPVDYIAVGPVFPTLTKARPAPVVGTELIRRARAACPCPVVAIGGMNAQNASSAVAAGAHGVAVVSAILTAADPEAATRELVAALAP